jgi:membrane protease YdiL (CAAX protease family)
MIAGGLVAVAMVLVHYHGNFNDANQLKEAVRSAVLEQPSVMLASAAATQAMLLLTALCSGLLSPKRIISRLRIGPSALSPFGYIVAVVGALAVSFCFSLLISVLHFRESGVLKALGDVFKKLTPTELVFAIGIVGILPGLAEELLFRGYAQTRLVERMGRWPGIFVAAALFGLMHADRLQSPFAFAFGIYLGYIAEKAGSIRPTMVCHAVNNSLQVYLGWKLAGGHGEPDRHAAAYALAVGLIVLGVCLLYFNFAAKSQPMRAATRGAGATTPSPPGRGLG